MVLRYFWVKTRLKIKTNLVGDVCYGDRKIHVFIHFAINNKIN